MNENYLRALEGIEELKEIFNSKEKIEKRLGLETVKIDRELLTDKHIKSIISDDEIVKMAYVLSSELFISNEIQPLIENTLNCFSRSIKLMKKEYEKEKYILQFNQIVFDFYLVLGQYLVIPKDDTDSNLELMYLSKYLNSIVTENVFDVFNVKDKINEIKEVNEQYYLNQIKTYLSSIDYFDNLIVATLQTLCKSWVLSISDFKFLDESYTISKYLYGMTIFEKKKKEVIDKPIKNETLYDIWLGETTDYLKEIFSKLKEQNVICDLTFVSELEGKLIWNKDKRNWSKYLAGFYRVLIEKKWVNSNKTAPEIAKIFDETFNFQDKIDPKNFRHSALNIKEFYKKPFEFIIENNI